MLLFPRELPSRDGASDSAGLPSAQAPLKFLLLIFIVSMTLQPPVDPDFGWHLRTGLDLVQHQGRFPAADPYSHTMPDWPWVEHAWLADGIMGACSAVLGPWGLSAIILIFAAITIWAFLWSASVAAVGRPARLLAVAVVLWVGLPFLGVRPQMITLLGLGAVSWVWARFHHRHHEVSWTLPLLFLVWSNLHGGFTAGFFYLGLVILLSLVVDAVKHGSIPLLTNLIRNSTEPVPDRAAIGRLGGIVLLSAMATFLNPYGWRLHLEIFQSLTDSFMLQVLHEWQPVSGETRAGAWFIGYVGLLGVLMVGWYRRVEPLRMMTLVVFLFLALRHFRNIPFFLLLSVPFLADLFQQVGDSLMTVMRRMRGLARLGAFPLMSAAAIVLILLGPDHLEHVAVSAWSPMDYFQGTEYPIEALHWAQRHRDRMGTRLYNDYGYGGFILWWLPDEKVFIDGRMPAWRIGDRWIFYDYITLTTSEPPALGVLDKYGVDWGLVAKDTALERALRGRPDWESVYEDRKAVIYVKRST